MPSRRAIVASLATAGLWPGGAGAAPLRRVIPHLDIDAAGGRLRIVGRVDNPTGAVLRATLELRAADARGNHQNLRQTLDVAAGARDAVIGRLSVNDGGTTLIRLTVAGPGGEVARAETVLNPAPGSTEL